MTRRRDDEIITEVRKARAKLFKKCGGTLEGLFAHLKSVEKGSGWNLVRLKPKRLKPQSVR